MVSHIINRIRHFVLIILIMEFVPVSAGHALSAAEFKFSDTMVKQGDTIKIEMISTNPIKWGTIWFNEKAYHVFQRDALACA